jgi:hypothetical protein
MLNDANWSRSDSAPVGPKNVRVMSAPQASPHHGGLVSDQIAGIQWDVDRTMTPGSGRVWC